MDIFQYADDEVIRSYIKKEPIVSHILPVEKITKSVPPKEFEKMFEHGSETTENRNFNAQYQKKINKLKKEYGEREINPDLIKSLRNRTKDAQNKISELFQD
jgi:hypothetical protein